MKKFLSWLLIALGLFFITGVLSLMNSHRGGAIFLGIITLLCFWGAYKLYPKKKKSKIRKSDKAKSVTQEKENKTLIKNNKESDVSYASFKDPKYNKVAHNIVDYFKTIQELSYFNLTEEDLEDLENQRFKVQQDMMIFPEDTFSNSNDSMYSNPLACMLSILMDESACLQDAIYYIDDGEISWIEDINSKIEDINLTFEFLKSSLEE